MPFCDVWCSLSSLSSVSSKRVNRLVISCSLYFNFSKGKKNTCGVSMLDMISPTDKNLMFARSCQAVDVLNQVSSSAICARRRAITSARTCGHLAFPKPDRSSPWKIEQNLYCLWIANNGSYRYSIKRSSALRRVECSLKYPHAPNISSTSSRENSTVFLLFDFDFSFCLGQYLVWKRAKYSAC